MAKHSENKLWLSLHVEFDEACPLQGASNTFVNKNV